MICDLDLQRILKKSLLYLDDNGNLQGVSIDDLFKGVAEQLVTLEESNKVLAEQMKQLDLRYQNDIQEQKSQLNQTIRELSKRVEDNIIELQRLVQRVKNSNGEFKTTIDRTVAKNQEILSLFIKLIGGENVDEDTIKNL